MRWRVQLGLFVAAWAIYDLARWIVGARVSHAVEPRSLRVPRLRLRPAVVEAPA
jgi:hypothetical protein